MTTTTAAQSSPDGFLLFVFGFGIKPRGYVGLCIHMVGREKMALVTHSKGGRSAGKLDRLMKYGILVLSSPEGLFYLVITHLESTTVPTVCDQITLLRSVAS
jgi:hypothetical protein